MTAERIRQLNDALRTTFEGGTVVTTPLVRILGNDKMAELLDRVRTFTAFDSDNDPYEEHDFGSIEFDGRQFFFKIDYYDKSMMFASDDPSDPDKTNRVITIMRADEY
jgi:hypothetical protein